MENLKLFLFVWAALYVIFMAVAAGVVLITKYELTWKQWIGLALLVLVATLLNAANETAKP